MRYIDWVLPLNVKNVLKRIFKKQPIISEPIKQVAEQIPLLKRNKELNNSVGDNKTCYILACGPSINEMDLSKLIGEDCISVSNFFVHPLYNQIKPNYHVFAPTHEPITEEQYNSWIKDYHDKTPFETKLFLNLLDKPMTDKVENSSTIHRYFYQLTDQMPEFFEDISLDNPLPRIQTVVHIAIYVAIALGYKEIRLLGVDHDWILNHGKTSHFYDESESELSNRGYEEYHENNNSVLITLKSYIKLWDIYISASKYVKSKKINIFNLTPNSMLDVFPQKKV